MRFRVLSLVKVVKAEQVLYPGIVRGELERLVQFFLIIFPQYSPAFGEAPPVERLVWIQFGRPHEVRERLLTFSLADQDYRIEERYGAVLRAWYDFCEQGSRLNSPVFMEEHLGLEPEHLGIVRIKITNAGQDEG